MDWTFEKRFKMIDSLLSESIRNKELLMNEPTENWKIILDSDYINQALDKKLKSQFIITTNLL